MTVTVNGQRRHIAPGTTVQDIVSEVAPQGPRGTAVAVNGEVVPRWRWSTVSLEVDDRVEVLSAIGGG